MIAPQRHRGPRPRLLLIAYQFPPVGGAGVQRVAKFAKYLPQHGWDVSVLTVSNPSVPVTDASLLAEIPATTVFRYARTWEPGYAFKSSLSGNPTSVNRQAVKGILGTDGILTGRRLTTYCKGLLKRLAHTVVQPDPQILWVPNAIATGQRLLRETPHDAILASGPPFSSFLVAQTLAKRSGLPMILDYRDEWTISNRYWENKSNGRLADWLGCRLETRVLRQADHVLATTEFSADALRETVMRAGSQAQVSCLWNGFDPEDIEHAMRSKSANAPQRPGCFRLAHIGTLWRLTSPSGLLAAIQRLVVLRPNLAARFELELVGRTTDAEQPIVRQLKALPITVREHNYVEHPAAVRAMLDADELCVMLSDVPGAERVMPAKTFEYLATQKPILAIAPKGELQRVLKRQTGVSLFSPSDSEGICRHLIQKLESASPEKTLQLQNKRRDDFACDPCVRGHGSLPPLARDLNCFDRRSQAGQLARLLDRLRPEGSRD